MMDDVERERAAIVAWLRAARPARKGGAWGRILATAWMIFAPTSFLQLAFRTSADAIERGDHRTYLQENPDNA